MSAIRDKSQKISFIYTNLYAVYRRGQQARPEMSGPRVIRAEELAETPVTELASVRIQAFRPVEFLKPRQDAVIAKPAVLKAALAPNPAVRELRASLGKLNDLHARLKFMLQELEDLVKE